MTNNVKTADALFQSCRKWYIIPKRPTRNGNIIKPRRDEEPKVPITLTDAEIDQLGARHWPEPQPVNIPVPRDVAVEYLKRGEDNSGLAVEDIPQKPHITFDLHNTKVISNTPVILTQDWMVMHIILANQFKKPVYFAVTVSPQNMLGMDNRRNDKPNFLRMDGLAFKVMPYGGPDDYISPQQLEENLFGIRRKP